MTVNGTNFVSTSVVRFNGSDRSTTFVSSTQVTAAIPDTDNATGGTRNGTEFKPPPGGGQSKKQTFTVSNPAPTTFSLAPSPATAGDPAFNPPVHGTNFA